MEKVTLKLRISLEDPGKIKNRHKEIAYMLENLAQRLKDCDEEGSIWVKGFLIDKSEAVHGEAKMTFSK